MVDLTTKPHSLTHIGNISFDEDNQLIVNEIVGVDENGVVRKVPVGTDGSLITSSTSLPLPTGAATSAKQDTGNTSLASIDTKIDALTTPSDTQPISAASLPLPSGASTAANQATANAFLGGIAGLTPAAYDYISLSYTGSNLTGVVFKSGGSGGTTIATLTLAYSGSTLTSVTKT
jgi:hypothetical protein